MSREPRIFQLRRNIYLTAIARPAQFNGPHYFFTRRTEMTENQEKKTMPRRRLPQKCLEIDCMPNTN